MGSDGSIWVHGDHKCLGILARKSSSIITPLFRFAGLAQLSQEAYRL
jgi:hypothetical protein